jgi:hypothetical protein
MPDRDLFRRLLERVLPWLDPAEYDRERERSRRIVDRANRLIAAYERFDQVLRR